MEDMTNGLLRQRMVGLAVLLALVFLLSLLLPGRPEPADDLPSTTVTLDGSEVLSEADAVPPPDDLPPEPIDETHADALPPADPSVTIADVGSLDAAPTDEAAERDAPPASAPTPAPQPGVKRGGYRSQDVAEPKPSAKPAPSVAAAAVENRTASPPPPSPPSTAPSPAVANKPAAATPKPKAAEAPTPPKSSVSAAKPKAAEPAPAAGSEPDGWYVQVGSFSEVGSAQTIVTLLKRLGVSASITRITGGKGKPLHRVRAGPYPSEAAARAAYAKVARNGYPQARVVHEASR